jgi:transcriptional regulator with XRE-family HTH domain
VAALEACPVLKPRGIAMTKDEFAARLRELREEKGMTQGQLAGMAGVSEQAVAQWERGLREPTWSNMVAVADALGVSTEAFRQPPKEVPPKRKAGRPRKAPPAAGQPPPPGPPAGEPESRKPPKGGGKK